MSTNQFTLDRFKPWLNIRVNDLTVDGISSGISGSGIKCDAFGNLFIRNSEPTIVGANNTFLGCDAGNSANAGNQNVYIGKDSGLNSSNNTNGVGVGYLSASTNQGIGAIAIGAVSGNTDQGAGSIAIGLSAGNNNQSTNSVAIGNSAGEFVQDSNAIAIGNSAGNNSQGLNAIAIGNNAGDLNQHQNTIVMNAGVGSLNTVQADSLYINPIRNFGGNGQVLTYDPVSKEINYEAKSSSFTPAYAQFNTAALYSLPTSGSVVLQFAPDNVGITLTSGTDVTVDEAGVYLLNLSVTGSIDAIDSTYWLEIRNVFPGSGVSNTLARTKSNKVASPFETYVCSCTAVCDIAVGSVIRINSFRNTGLANFIIDIIHDFNLTITRIA